MTVTSTTLDAVLNKIGSWYTINVGSEVIDIRGNGSVNWVVFSGVGYVQILNNTDDAVQMGLMNIGDALGYFKLSSNITVGSKLKINHQGYWYEMMGDPLIPHISGNQLLKQVNLRKVIE
jgi:hypothetical protein